MLPLSAPAHPDRTVLTVHAVLVDAFGQTDVCQRSDCTNGSYPLARRHCRRPLQELRK